MIIELSTASNIPQFGGTDAPLYYDKWMISV